MFTGFRQTRSALEVQYDVEPALLAQLCQRVLGEMGSVKSVSRQTGAIAGKLNVWGGVQNPVEVLLIISRAGTQTRLTIAATQKQAPLSLSGDASQKKIAEFLEKLAQSPELAGRSLAGW